MFALVALLLLIGGGILQSLDLHIGLIASQFICIAIPAFLLRKRFEISSPLLGGKKNPSVIALVVITTPIIAIASNLIALLIMQSSPALMELGSSYQVGLERLLHPAALWRQILGFLAICLVAPICEEYFFRGTLLQKQRTHSSWPRAIIINGFLFSLVHANPVAFISLWIIGAFFASLSKRSLFLSILAHTLLNATSGFLSFLPKEENMAPDKIETLAVLGALALLIPVVFLLWKKTLSLIDSEENPAH